MRRVRLSLVGLGIASILTIADVGLAGNCGCGREASCNCEAPVKVHVHYIPVPRLGHCLCGPSPPNASIVESAAVRRVPVPSRTNFRVQQESGELKQRPEGGEASCGSEKLIDALKSVQNGKVDALQQRLDLLDEKLNRLVGVIDKLLPAQDATGKGGKTKGIAGEN